MRWGTIALLVSTVVVAACEGKDSGPLYEVHCTESIPTFGRSSHVPRTPELDANLCKCIWAHLDGNDRFIAEKISKDEWHQISALDKDRFYSHFGKIAVECGP
jgi:hypothetical protein